jgi:hypothetical protein
MKTGSLHLLVIVCAALMAGTIRADRRDAASQAPSSQSSASVAGTHHSISGARNRQTKPRTTVEQQLHHGARVTTANETNNSPNGARPAPQSVRPDRAQPAAHGPAIQGAMARNAVPSRPPGGVAESTATHIDARHRIPNPGVGGIATTRAMNSASINGTRMPRKP